MAHGLQQVPTEPSMPLVMVVFIGPVIAIQEPSVSRWAGPFLHTSYINLLLCLISIISLSPFPSRSRFIHNLLLYTHTISSFDCSNKRSNLPRVDRPLTSSNPKQRTNSLISLSPLSIYRNACRLYHPRRPSRHLRRLRQVYHRQLSPGDRPECRRHCQGRLQGRRW